MLVSTTLTGNNAAIIGEALASVVNWVDRCLVIDTGVTDDSLAIARAIAKDKFVARKFAWSRDFAAARNFALDAAHEIGGTWAVTLDTDERVFVGQTDVRARLAATTEGVVMLPYEDRTYVKERFFKLPVTERFTGPTHEAYAAYKVGSKVFDDGYFSELPKTKDQSAAKFKRDVDILRAHTKKHPKDPRWHYYLGDSFRNLGRYEEAIAAYRACSKLRGWNEESAWACYHEAECWLARGLHNEAIDACARGLALHAGIAELAWLAGFASWRSGHHEQAAFWAKMAIPMGHFRGDGKGVHRIGFKNVNALYEGPFDILRFALRSLGQEAAADRAEADYHEAIAARTLTPAAAARITGR